MQHLCKHCGQVCECALDLPGEKWRQIQDAPDYHVSTLGRVKSFRRRIDGLMLCQSVGSNGYYVVNIMSRKPSPTCPVHILVAEAFIGNRPSGYVVNHKNGNKLSNQLTNLEYIPFVANMKHAADNGLMQRGEKRWNARLNIDVVRYIRANPQISYRKLELETGFHWRTIADVRQGRTWKHVI